MSRAIKVYSLGSMSYSYSPTTRGWVYKMPTATYIAHCKGLDAGHKVANIIQGSLVRTNGKGLDGLARSNISKILFAK